MHPWRECRGWPQRCPHSHGVLLLHVLVGSVQLPNRSSPKFRDAAGTCGEASARQGATERVYQADSPRWRWSTRMGPPRVSTDPPTLAGPRRAPRGSRPIISAGTPRSSAPRQPSLRAVSGSHSRGLAVTAGSASAASGTQAREQRPYPANVRPVVATTCIHEAMIGGPCWEGAC